MIPIAPTPLVLFGCLAGGYLLGSIPFGVIATRLGRAGNLRKIGSGSIGATNVLRTGRWDLAAITLIGDAGKGALAVLLAIWFVSPTAGVIAGGGAFLGHLYSVWLGFRGGKGIATAFGVLLAVAWPVAIAAGLMWLAMAMIFRYSSLASLTATVMAPICLILLYPLAYLPRLWLLIAMAVLIAVKHRDNIRRLLAGEESKIGGARA
jgi:acyl phosphate:glycerol-3-phosphate acyltransferase